MNRFSRPFVHGLMLLLAALACVPPAQAQRPGDGDPSWVRTAVGDTDLHQIALQPDGKLVALGFEWSTQTLRVARFHADGRLDGSFGAGGAATPTIPMIGVSGLDITVSTSGLIHVAGRGSRPAGQGGQDLFVTRLLADGRQDPSFGSNGVALYSPAVNSIYPYIPPMLAVQPDGKVLLMALLFRHPPTDREHIVVGRLLANGQPDTAFGTNGSQYLPFASFNGYVHAMRLAPDGSIFIAIGSSGEAAGGVVKLRPDGQFDASFGVAGTAGGEQGNGILASDIAIQADGKVVVAGGILGPNGYGVGIYRLNPDGTPDTSFATNGTGFYDAMPLDDYIVNLALQPGGKIVVAGNINVGHDTGGARYDRAVLARFTTTGQLDPRFGNGGYVVAPGAAAMDLELDGTRAGYVLLNESPTDNPLALQTSIFKFFTMLAPVVTLPGGDRTYADTDGVTGEIVTITGSASDLDGTLASVSLTVNGNAVAAGTAATLELGDGTNVVTLTAIDDEGLQGSASVTYVVLPAPSQLPAWRWAATSTQGTTTSEFGLAARNSDNVPVNTVGFGETMHITGIIFPEPADLDAVVDVFVVVDSPRGWFMRDTAGDFVAWNTRIADLVPAYEDRPLSAQSRVPVYSGSLPWVGSYAIHLGYRRNDGSALIYLDAWSAPRLIIAGGETAVTSAPR